MDKYYLHFSQSGNLLSRYVFSVHGDAIPEDAVEVSQALFEQTIVENDGVWMRNTDESVTKHPHPANMADIKTAAFNRVAASFADALLQGCTVSLGYKMDATLQALQNLKTGFDLATLLHETSMTVVDYDNGVHANVAMADVEKILKEVGGNYRALYMTKQQLRGQIEAATTAEAANAVAWPTN